MSEHRTDHNCAGADCATCLSRELAAAQAENERLRKRITDLEQARDVVIGMARRLAKGDPLRSVEKGKEG